MPGEGVDEMIRHLESGQPLPPDPNQEGLDTETSEEFMNRVDKLKAAYDAQFLPKKDWEVLSSANHPNLQESTQYTCTLQQHFCCTLVAKFAVDHLAELCNRV